MQTYQSIHHYDEEPCPEFYNNVAVVPNNNGDGTCRPISQKAQFLAKVLYGVPLRVNLTILHNMALFESSDSRAYVKGNDSKRGLEMCMDGAKDVS
jgi:hypothetical protein